MAARIYDLTAYRAARLEQERRVDELVREVTRLGMDAPVSAVERACAVVGLEVRSGRADHLAMAAARAVLFSSLAVDEE